MSRTIRKQLFRTLESLCKASTLLEKLIAKKKCEDTIQILMDCQDCAIAIGNQIDAIYGEGTESVHELENFCETIYQLSMHLENNALSRKFYVKFFNELAVIRQKMEQEIPDKLEVVFLPYKASMWDSLESVWFAARDDRECDDYVIPIPYYDKNPDGSFREEHWEGNEYPDYVPITKYDEYDFELRKPDVIYIHNPYDDGNYVTSVHPFFYSKNLRRFTEKLVYIPYFVLEEIEAEDWQTVEKMKDFCLTVGVLNADKVIVQSETMRKVYINNLAKFHSKSTKEILEKKILGIGSPKFDSIANTKKEDVVIPDDWKRIIQKDDKSYRKIILYNTSVSSLLQYEEQMLKKMQRVFQIFKERKEDVALLWRPHPLIKATISSMRPQLFELYEAMVNQYKEENWGIYDDTSDLYRAITMCDLYYGDRSSVVRLCRKAGKIIMIQNVKV